MSAQNDGGPAFPVPIKKVQWDTRPQDFHENDCAGMSLRDWFAGMALHGMIDCSLKWGIPENNTQAAGYCYAIADAMIAQRNKL